MVKIFKYCGSFMKTPHNSKCLVSFNQQTYNIYGSHFVVNFLCKEKKTADLAEKDLLSKRSHCLISRVK